jgi:hypothetical protein
MQGVWSRIYRKRGTGSVARERWRLRCSATLQVNPARSVKQINLMADKFAPSERRNALEINVGPDSGRGFGGWGH